MSVFASLSRHREAYSGYRKYEKSSSKQQCRMGSYAQTEERDRFNMPDTPPFLACWVSQPESAHLRTL